MRKRLRKWRKNPVINLWGSVVFGALDLGLAIRYALAGSLGPALYNWVLYSLMVWCGVYWARRLREQNGGVLWIPRVKLERQFDSIKKGAYLVWCGACSIMVGDDGLYYKKPGHPDWEVSLQLATEMVVEEYRNGKLQKRENRKIKRRILKEARRGHRGNAANDPSGAAEGAGGQSGGQPPAKEGAITASGGFCAPLGSVTISGTASPSLTKLLTGQTSVGLYSEIPDDDTTQPPEPDEELDTYTIPVWGFRSWNLLESGVPKLGSLNSGRHVWTPGVNVAICQAADYEMRSSSGSVAFSIRSSGNWKVHVPGDNCACGFYAVRDVFDVQPGIIGGVVGWGKVVDGEKGWRSEKAAVAALFRAPWGSVEEQQKVEMLAELYGVPVCLTLIDLADKTRELAEWMAGDDLLERLPT